MRFFNVSGTTGFTIPEGAKPVYVAGETAWLFIEDGQAKLWAKLGAAAGTVLAKNKYRPCGKLASEKIVSNRRGTAAALLLALNPGQCFEAMGYSRISPWKRYCFDGQTIVCEAL
jgi:hypothetical protein